MPSSHFRLGFLSPGLDCIASLALMVSVADSSRALNEILHAFPRNVRAGDASRIVGSDAFDFRVARNVR